MIKKKDLIERVVNDIWENRYTQEDYILDLIEYQVMTWDEDELKQHLGIDPDDE